MMTLKQAINRACNCQRMSCFIQFLRWTECGAGRGIRIDRKWWGGRWYTQ